MDHRQISTLVDDEENIYITLKFRGKDAAFVINTIEKVRRFPLGLPPRLSTHLQIILKGQVPPTTRLQALQLMWRLAGASCQVPKSYLIGTFARYNVEKRVIAKGGFADIRKGKLNGMDIAVKTIRIQIKNEKELQEIHEVRNAADCLILGG